MKIERLMRRANFISSDPAWEAMKAARRNLRHDDAVQMSFFLLKQYRSLWRSHVPSPVDVYVILKTLRQKRIPFVLTGGFSIGGWTGRPMSTQDVDILVKAGRNYGRTVNTIQSLYPQLEARPFPGFTAFLLQGESLSVIDVIYPHRADLEETLAMPVWTENREQGLRYRVAALEAILTNKYGAMITPTREIAQRMQDIADFSLMVTHSSDEGRQPIDMPLLEKLGEKVRPGGGREILRMVARVKAGHALSLESLGK
jgi:hypothetical protein